MTKYEGFEEVTKEEAGTFEDGGFGWDDEIEKDSDFVVLPAGDYFFTVVEFERARYEGGDKLPACNKAIVSLEIKSPDGDTKVKHNLFLHSKTEGMLSAFFMGIGQKKKGEKLKMNWGKVVGAKGKAKIKIKTYNGNEYNEVQKFYPYEESFETAKNEGSQVSFSKGEF